MDLDVMLPYWGDEQHLFDAVESVLAQTDPRWRLTVIDDAYPSPRVPEYFRRLDDARVTYLRNNTNQGIVAGFRRSLDLAHAPWVCVFGCDDLMERDYVATIKDMIARNPHCDIFQPGVQVIGSSGEPERTLVDLVKQRILAPRAGATGTVLTGEDLATSLLRGNWLYWPSLVLRSETARRIGFADDLPIILDLDLLVNIAFESGSLSCRTEPQVFRYRRHRASASQRTLLDGQRFRDERRFYRDTARRARRLGWHRAARAARWRLMSRLHAATELPRVMRRGTRAGIRATLAHIFGS